MWLLLGWFCLLFCGTVEGGSCIAAGVGGALSSGWVIGWLIGWLIGWVIG
jgi:hypothetical protein